MASLKSEDLLLQQALRDGLLTAEDVAATAHATTLPASGRKWGPQIDELIQRGRLREEDVQRLGQSVLASTKALKEMFTESERSLGLEATQSGPASGPREDSMAISGSAPALAVTMSDEAAGLAATMNSETSGLPNAPPSDSDRYPAPHWDRYEFISLLGRGGMGAVYKARDRRLGRIVALKFIRGDDPGQSQRFLQEARAQARLEHLNICKVYEVGFVDGKPYIAMEFVDGVSLDKAAQKLDPEDKLRLIRDVALAVHVAHEQGIVHRDIKPSNIMVERLGNSQLRPVLMDFGLARDRDASASRGLTESGAVLGTPAYMSPEQARGGARHVDRRSDVYSLGATLYDILAGRPPFQDETAVNIILKVMNDVPTPLRSLNADIPEAVELVVNKCLNKEAEQRYPTAQSLAEDLERYLRTQSVTARRLRLTYRVLYFARRNRALSALAVALLLSLMGLGAFGVYTRIVNLRRDEFARKQAALQQRLGQEISTMEWMLRSARQLPLHDLGREKVIIRESMAQLEAEMASYGDIGRGLAHYALGRGHMALHEYPEALKSLEQSFREGNQSADLSYSLGVVLGKHYEQAMYEARLSGGGDWAKQRLKEIEPKYLQPAIDSLKRSRAMNSKAPSYLEALIAYYQRDYEVALKHAAVALRKAPWLYEASKLAGDVHLERALQARDSGRADEAEREFADAVKRYGEAAYVGQSDAEVYEGLAEAWVRQIEMALHQGQPADAAYAAALAASAKITTAEPESISGPLKKAFATMMTMVNTGTGRSAQELVQKCLAATEEVLKKQPGHPYARDTAAGCYWIAGESARARGENPEPLWNKALALLEPALRQYPQFLWGLNDIGNIYQAYGSYLRLTGQPAAKEFLDKSIVYFDAAQTLDSTYTRAPLNLLGTLSETVLLATSVEALQSVLVQSDKALSICKSINTSMQLCYNNYFLVYARAAMRSDLAGTDPQAQLQRAFENLALMRKLGGSILEAEQHDALARWVDAKSRLRRNEDPTPALKELQEALRRCFGFAAQDVVCRTLSAQSQWVTADWLALQKKPFRVTLEDALAKVELATQSPEKSPEAWQVLAETHLRLAGAQSVPPALQERHLLAGLAAAAKIFSINPNHALGWATKGALELARAQRQPPSAAQKAAAQAAVEALERALKGDPFLTHNYAPLLTRAKQLSS